MVIEITTTEFVLLVWAILVTGFFIDAKRETLIARKFILHLVHNDDEREEFVRECKKSRAEYQARINRS